MCNVVYALLMQDRSPEDREALDSDLYAPPGIDTSALQGMGRVSG